MGLEKPRSVSDSPFRSAKWDEVTSGREFAESDAPTVALLCAWYEVVDKCMSDIDVGGEIQVAYSNEMGDIKALPQLATMAKASAEIRAINKQLGIGEHEETTERPRAKVTPFDRIVKQREQGPARKPRAKVSGGA